MKSKDLQNIVLSKNQKHHSPIEAHRDLNDRISLATIKSWCPMIHQSATRDRCCYTDSQSTEENLQKVKNHFRQKTEGINSKISENKCQTNIRNRFGARIP